MTDIRHLQAEPFFIQIAEKFIWIHCNIASWKDDFYLISNHDARLCSSLSKQKGWYMNHNKVPLNGIKKSIRRCLLFPKKENKAWRQSLCWLPLVVSRWMEKWKIHDKAYHNRDRINCTFNILLVQIVVLFLCGGSFLLFLLFLFFYWSVKTFSVCLFLYFSSYFFLKSFE
jgi:hypothetical protein